MKASITLADLEVIEETKKEQELTSSALNSLTTELKVFLGKDEIVKQQMQEGISEIRKRLDGVITRREFREVRIRLRKLERTTITKESTKFGNTLIIIIVTVVVNTIVAAFINKLM